MSPEVVGDRLLAAIRRGKSTDLEFEEAVFAEDDLCGPSSDQIADSLAALANAKGGVYLLGIRDHGGEVVGIPLDRLDAVERIVREVCTASITPPLEGAITKIELPTLDGTLRAVLRVDVDRSLSLHQSPGGHFERFGASKRQLSTDRIVRLAQQRSHSRLLSFDEEVVPRASFADLELGLIERFRGAGNQDDVRVLGRKLGMLREEAPGSWHPTVAGVLLGTRRPQTFVRGAWVQAVCYRGSEVTAGTAYQIDARDLDGPLDQQIGEACAFVFRNMRVGASKDVGRRDVPQFDRTVVFEAITNAVAHRDYSLQGSHVRLFQFADRLEVRSPGGLANGLDVESLAERQVARNSTIASLLAKIGVPAIERMQTSRTTIMDRRGEGVPLILRRTAELAGRPATFRVIDDAELVVTIPAASAGPTGTEVVDG